MVQLKSAQIMTIHFPAALGGTALSAFTTSWHITEYIFCKNDESLPFSGLMTSIKKTNNVQKLTENFGNVVWTNARFITPPKKFLLQNVSL
jgi:hypothetical protein